MTSSFTWKFSAEKLSVARLQARAQSTSTWKAGADPSTVVPRSWEPWSTNGAEHWKGRRSRCAKSPPAGYEPHGLTPMDTSGWRLSRLANTRSRLTAEQGRSRKSSSLKRATVRLLSVFLRNEPAGTAVAVNEANRNGRHQRAGCRPCWRGWGRRGRGRGRCHGRRCKCARRRPRGHDVDGTGCPRASQGF